MIEFQIEGRTRGFKFGTYTFKLINQLTGEKSIEEVFALLDGSDKTPMERIEFKRMFFLACAQHYAMSKKQEIDFNELDVSDWIDEIGYTDMQTYLGELIKVYLEKASKNSKALETGQLQSTNGTH